MPVPSAHPNGLEGRDLERSVTRVCSTRVVFLFLLLVPLTMVWLGENRAETYFYAFRYPLFPLFLILGFGINIVFLLTWKKFANIGNFFRLQLVTDSLLAAGLVLFTGGLSSGFLFLFWGLVFLYGRLLGVSAGLAITAAVALFLLGTGIWQHHSPHLWHQQPSGFEELAYSVMLQLLAMGLVLLLLKMGQGAEERLLLSLARKDQALKESEALKRGVFDWIESGLMVCDPAGVISAMNQQAARWAGLPSTEAAIGLGLGEVFPEVWRVWQDHPERKIDRMEVERDRDQGVFGLRISPIPEGRGSLIIFTDITRVRKLEGRVVQMEKMATVGELAAGLAHEIKNPLAGIKASIQLMGGGGLTPEQEERLRQVVSRDIQRLDHLLSDFLAYARPSQAEPQPVAVLEVAEECVGLVRASHPQVAFTVQRKSGADSWLWDRDQLKQVLYNLILNAVQAIEDMENPSVEVALAVDEGGEHLAIRDNGPGVDPSKAQQLFDPFVTTKPKGTGLGLAIARRLAGQNNAWVELDNRPQGGAEARVYKAREV